MRSHTPRHACSRKKSTSRKYDPPYAKPTAKNFAGGSTTSNNSQEDISMEGGKLHSFNNTFRYIIASTLIGVIIPSCFHFYSYKLKTVYSFQIFFIFNLSQYTLVSFLLRSLYPASHTLLPRVSNVIVFWCFHFIYVIFLSSFIGSGVLNQKPVEVRRQLGESPRLVLFESLDFSFYALSLRYTML